MKFYSKLCNNKPSVALQTHHSRISSRLYSASLRIVSFKASLGYLSKILSQKKNFFVAINLVGQRHLKLKGLYEMGLWGDRGGYVLFTLKGFRPTLGGKERQAILKLLKIPDSKINSYL